MNDQEQAAICAFRSKTLLPLDDCYVALKDQIPALSRSNLHRCLQRNGLSVLPQTSPEERARKRFKEYPIGYFHVDTLSAGAAGETLTGGGGQDTLMSFIGGSTNFADIAANLNGNTIGGFINSDQIDLKDLAFATASLGFSVNSGNGSGTLSVSDGTHAATINMTGQFAAAGFYATTDGAQGTQVGYGSLNCGLPPLPPLGCSSQNAQCTCDASGHCEWIFTDCH